MSDILRAVVRTFVDESGQERHQACLVRFADANLLGAGELVLAEDVLFDSAEEAYEKAEELMEQFLAVLGKVAGGVG